MIAYCADYIFTGESILPHHAIVTHNDIVVDITAQVSLDNSIQRIQYGKHMLVPAFIDAQIYGSGNLLFSEFKNVESLIQLQADCEKSGVAYFLPTVATNTQEVMFACIDAVKEYWKLGKKGCLGVHFEGPWISVEKRGVHKENCIYAPTLQQVKDIIEYGKGVIKMITLAPEVCSNEVVEYIHSQDIIIAAGHSNANYTQATTAFNNGVNVVTHLYNAMSSFHHREPGMVGAVFNHAHVMASIIPDGYHVDYTAIQIAKKLLGNRLFTITDAVTATTSGAYKHVLNNDFFETNGTLSGSALTMIKATQNLVAYAGIDIVEALKMASLYPANVLKIDHQSGKIKKGYPVNFIVLDSQLNIQQTVFKNLFM